jgi:SAM-dependent methyltransferase
MTATRLCPRCGAAEPIGETDDIWPRGWLCLACGHAVAVSSGIPMFAPELADTKSGFNPADFASLAAVEREHFWFVPRNRLIVGLTERYFPAATSLLEVGCGTGTVLSAIAVSRPWRRLTGSELHPIGLTEARRRLGGRASFVQMDARFIPAREAFDVVGAFDVIEHIIEDEKVLAAMRDAIVPGGGVIVSAPQHPFLWSEVDDKSYHVRRYRRGEIEKKLVHTGLRVVFSGSYTALLFPFMAVNRMRRLRGGGGRRTVQHNGTAPLIAEFRLPRMVNACARAVLQAEVSATLAGMRFPFGGSRIVVAIKP